MKRFCAGLAIAAALAPSLWFRSAPPSTTPDLAGQIGAVAFAPARAGPFRLVAAWEISGTAPMFGGFSALALLPDGRLLAGTDGGRKLVFSRPDQIAPGSLEPRLTLFGPSTDVNKVGADLEALTTDPDSGIVWGAYESANSIRRFDRQLQEMGAVGPDAMQDWGYNSGPEALARLPDGRFVVIEEGARSFGAEAHRALLFALDPLSGERPMPFEVLVPDGYRPVDLVAVDADRALVLLRKVRFGLPPRFESAIGIIDLAGLSEGARVMAGIIAVLDERFLPDNYEGMALSDDADGRHLWLISDDNLMGYQNTYLLKLRWNAEGARQKARE